MMRSIAVSASTMRPHAKPTFLVQKDIHDGSCSLCLGILHADLNVSTPFLW